MANAIPNFDAMTPSELSAFWKKHHRAGSKLAQELVGDRRKGFTLIAAKLAAYALNKAIAMELREKGQIARAQTYEQACDIAYAQLPEDLRW